PPPPAPPRRRYTKAAIQPERAGRQDLARAMVTAGWLTEAAAWTHILPAARRLQQEYRSWEEMSRNFMVGRHYWGEGGATQAKFDAAAAWLLANQDSPWRRLAWTTRLS
ncbi:MAG TPA: DUF1266 domain-containing protein, partial [Thermoanaerobaculia bacterium]|nr:DUF1266 domain-containing protein [Thermoanaerobaculia bacterium]